MELRNQEIRRLVLCSGTIDITDIFSVLSDVKTRRQTHLLEEVEGDYK
jgi:hypothetical protein